MGCGWIERKAGKLSNLEELSLDNDLIDDDAIAFLIQAFREGAGANLSSIRLHTMCIGETSIRLIATALQDGFLPKLDCLTLFGFDEKKNPAMTGKEAKEILHEALRASGRDRRAQLFFYYNGKDENFEDEMLADYTL